MPEKRASSCTSRPRWTNPSTNTTSLSWPSMKPITSTVHSLTTLRAHRPTCSNVRMAFAYRTIWFAISRMIVATWAMRDFVAITRDVTLRTTWILFVIGTATTMLNWIGCEPKELTSPRPFSVSLHSVSFYFLYFLFELRDLIIGFSYSRSHNSATKWLLLPQRLHGQAEQDDETEQSGLLSSDQARQVLFPILALSYRWVSLQMTNKFYVE